MQIIWLGHASFRIEIGGHVLLIDPWLDGNPSFPDARRAEALSGATHIFLTHGHGDHASEAAGIATECGIPIHCIHELAEGGLPGDAERIGFGKGGTINLPGDLPGDLPGNLAGDTSGGTPTGVQVTMVNATHSSSVGSGSGLAPAGSEAGFMIAGEGHTIYVSGDTDIMADMDWMGDYHKPDIGILCAGGHYTMDMDRAAYAARRYFNFKTVIPCHYRTFPVLAQSAEALVAGLPGVDVIEPEVLVPITI